VAGARERIVPCGCEVWKTPQVIGNEQAEYALAEAWHAIYNAFEERPDGSVKLPRERL